MLCHVDMCDVSEIPQGGLWNRTHPTRCLHKLRATGKNQVAAYY